MKRFMLTSKKFLSFILAFIIVFSTFSGIMEVNAAPEVLNITYEVIALDAPEEDSGSGVTAGSRLVIEGTNFENPIVRGGEFGTVKLNITEVSAEKDKIIIASKVELDKIVGFNINIIKVYNNNGADNLTGEGISFSLKSTPTIKSVSKDKAYVGDSLDIIGTVFKSLVPGTDTILVSGWEYPLSGAPDGNVTTADIIDDGHIVINELHSPNDPGLSNVKIIRRFGLDSENEVNRMITTELRNCIMVVEELKGITFDRIDPNSGPIKKPNIVNIYFSDGGSELSSNMRVFVQKLDAQNNIKELEGTNLGTIQSGSVNIGLKVRLPETWIDTGIVDIVIADKDRYQEMVIKNKFTYLETGNNLNISSISPKEMKESEKGDAIINGENIVFFNSKSYDKVIDVVYQEDIGYHKYLDFDELKSIESYKVRYTATYDEEGDGWDDDDPEVTIIREIWVTIGGKAEIGEITKYSSSSDIVVVEIPEQNLDIKEPTKFDVKVKTETTVFEEESSSIMVEKYNRVEEAAIIGGFTYYPDETFPYFEQSGITPAYGPNDQEIYMTIKGKDFEVKPDGTEPTIIIGESVISENISTTAQEIMVFDDNNKIVDGNIIKTGTKIKFRLPPDTDNATGGADVIVINPSEGQWTVENGFEFRNPTRSNMPSITQVKEDFSDIRGGVVSGETVLITGENFDTSADDTPRIVVTIDGEKATIMGKVSSDGKTVTIIPPPGTIPGNTKLQLINYDGSMYDIKFTYNLITTNPKITSIVPVKGGKGTKLIIKGEDFVLPDDSVDYDDPKFKGSVVLLGGMELNAYKYNNGGVITEMDPNNPDPLDPDARTGNIYYSVYYDHDGDPGTPDAFFDGHMVKVQDLTTIYVDIPDSFYSFVGGASPAAPYLKSAPIPIGLLKVEVLNPDGAKSKENITFNYMDASTSPRITGIAPSSGSVAGGTVVTITGSGFKQDYLEVYFGSEKSEKVEFINSTVIRATVPDYPYTLPNGQDYLDVPVMVMNYDGGVDVINNGFTYRVPASNPVITSITPNKGSSAGNDRVVIKGLDFRRTSDMAASGLPKVYFNGQEASVEWPAGNSSTITESLTVTTPPSLTSGAVEVILVNHDSGTCIFNGFTYIMSKPVINSVMPEKINKNGNVNIQINGSGFRGGDRAKLFTNVVERVNRNVTSEVYAEDVIETIVAFGDEDTKDKKTIDTVLGPMYTEIGDLGFDCEIESLGTEQVHIRIYNPADDTPDTHNAIQRYRMEDGAKVEDSFAEAHIPVGSSHLFIINHEMDLGKPNVYDEGILVETTPSSVTITRRIAASAEIEYDDTQLIVKAPPTDRIGIRNLYVINDDGGTATDEITIMSPDSSPVITSIDPKNRARESDTNQIVDYVPGDLAEYSQLFTFVPLDGGAFLTISGADFRRNVKVYLDDKPLEIVSKSINDDQLVIKVPSGTEADVGKDRRIVVVNEDGGTYDSSMLIRPHYIRYQTQESNPVIERIVPDKSSSRGSNRIAIYGNNFKAGVKVLIEGVECITTRDVSKPSELLSVLVPTGLKPGKKTVQVQNPDFGFVEVKDGLTIISSPEITGIFDDNGDEINPLVLSVEGGEKLKLEGIQFIEGIQVIFGGTLKAKSELATGESGLEGLNINNAEMVIIGGTLATEVKLQADGSILCTTPKLSMGQTSVIVINTDGGVSNEIRGEYQKPVPDTPGGLKVEVVDGDTLKLEWDKIEDVSYYEIFASVSETGKSTTGIYQYLGSIVPAEISATRLRYYLDGLMPSTWYSIKLRSVNLFGASKYSTSTGYYKTLAEKVVTFYQDETANTGGVEQKDSTVMNGMELTYTLGEKSIGSSTGAVVNFEQPSYIIANPKIVKISFELIQKHPSSKIKINDKDMELNLKASNLAVDEATRVDNSLKDDTDMRVSLNRSLGAEGDEIRIKLPRGYKIMVNPFSISLNMQVQNTTTRIKSFNGDISLLLKYAESKKSLYPGGVYIAYYDRTSGKMQVITTQNLNGKAQSQIIKTGEYVLIGKLVK